jgi:uncharacterized protein (TIGR03437 family)
VDGDGRADLCGRGSAGIYCALSNSDYTFQPLQLWTSHFSDASGWNQPQYATTINFGRINRDRSFDIVGRAPFGVEYALSPAPVALTITSIGNGASFTRSFAPGMLMSVFGNGMSSGIPQIVPGPPFIDFATGTTVTINGMYAPLLYVSATQINLQIPYQVTPGNATLIVSYEGKSSSMTFTIEAAAPGIFVDSTSGHIVPTESTPAGSTIELYLTGAGLVTPPEQTGNFPAAGTTPVPNLPLTMTVGSVPVTRQESGFGV